MDGGRRARGRHEAPPAPRRGGAAAAGAAPRHRHPGSPAVLRRAGAPLHRVRAVAPGLRPLRAAGWMRSARDIAVSYQWLLADLGLDESAWSASASAAGSRPRWRRMAPRGFRKLVLVGAMGIKPPEGDILDQALVSYIDYARAGFHDQAAFDARLRRRAADRPARAVGHQPRDDLPHRVEALHVQPDAAAPAGRRAGAGAGGVGRRRPDRAARARRALREGAAQGAGWRSSTACGHFVEMEQPEELAKLVIDVRRDAPDAGEIAMHLMYFTEQPMSAYPADEGLEVRRHRADVLEHATSTRSRAAGSTTSTSRNTSWPRRSASTASC